MRLILWCRGLAGAGELAPDPPAEDVLAHLQADYDTWGWADPMVELGWHEGSHLVDQLLVVRHPVRGFYCEYSGRRPERWAVAVAQAGGEWVPQMSNGAQAYFLACCFLPLAMAEQVVGKFIDNGALSVAVRWVPFEDLYPRRDRPPGG